MVVYKHGYIIQFLVLVATLVWISVFQLPDNNLHIIACDVGQGDAILITYKNTQILTDGGPNNRVTECLSKYMPFWDRDIELVISTHPDADHSTGLIDVVKRYKVDNLLINNLNPGTKVYEALESEVGGRGIKVIHPSKDMRLRVSTIYLDILHPSKDFESSKTNQYSIVTLLKYKDFEAIFTGDIDTLISDQVSTNNKIEHVDYIKIPHHGSKNGLSENLLKVIEPKIAVISVGSKNSYGHPHKEIIEMLNKYGAKILRTDELEDVEITTDGGRLWIEN